MTTANILTPDTPEVAISQPIKVRKVKQGVKSTKRKAVYEVLKLLKVGEGFDVSQENATNYYAACKYACKTYPEFAGREFSRRKADNGITIVRTK